MLIELIGLGLGCKPFFEPVTVIEEWGSCELAYNSQQPLPELK